MWTTLALAAALSVSPGQAGKLELTNVRPTYGLLGPTRPDTKVLAPEVLYLSFDIAGLKADPNGDLLYGLGLEVFAAGKDKPIYKQEDDKDAPKKVPNPFGGGRLAATSFLEIGRDLPAGKYTVKITAFDRVAATNVTTTQTFEVVPPALGLTRVDPSHDPGGQLPAPLVGVPGETVFLNGLVVGFDRDSKKNPNVTVTMKLLEGGKAVPAKPTSFDIDKLNEGMKEVPIQFRLDFTRAGEFTVEVTVEDKVSKKKAVVTLPLTIVSTEKK
jgi:hypothetical protein